MKSLVSSVGNWVSGERFWNRTEELRYFKELLEEGKHILLIAQRRVGKTSLMYKVSEQLSNDYICLHLDLENCQSAADMIVQLSVATQPHAGLWKQTKDVFKNALQVAVSTVESIGVDELTLKLRSGVSDDWQLKGNELIKAFDKSEKPVILFIDELPILVRRLLRGHDFVQTPERRQQTDQLMSWLRSIAIRADGTIRLVLTGSIGLEPVLRQASLSATINHMTPFELKPWEGATAIGCLEALSNRKGIAFEEGACDKVVKLLGSCIPHHVQLFFSKIYEDCRRRGVFTASVLDVERVYKERMLTSQGHVELSHMEERLKPTFDPQHLPLIYDLLTETAVVGVLTSTTAMKLAKDFGLSEGEGRTVLKNALYIFEHDGYLRKEYDRYVFVSKLLKDWWEGHHGFFFIPANKRTPA